MTAIAESPLLGEYLNAEATDESKVLNSLVASTGPVNPLQYTPLVLCAAARGHTSLLTHLLGRPERKGFDAAHQEDLYRHLLRRNDFDTVEWLEGHDITLTAEQRSHLLNTHADHDPDHYLAALTQEDVLPLAAIEWLLEGIPAPIGDTTIMTILVGLEAAYPEDKQKLYRVLVLADEHPSFVWGFALQKMAPLALTPRQRYLAPRLLLRRADQQWGETVHPTAMETVELKYCPRGAWPCSWKCDEECARTPTHVITIDEDQAPDEQSETIATELLRGHTESAVTSLAKMVADKQADYFSLLYDIVISRLSPLPHDAPTLMVALPGLAWLIGAHEWEQWEKPLLLVEILLRLERLPAKLLRPLLTRCLLPAKLWSYLGQRTLLPQLWAGDGDYIPSGPYETLHRREVSIRRALVVALPADLVGYLLARI